MPTTILEQTRTHPPRRGLGNNGHDAWQFDIAAGQQLAAVELSVEAAGPGCGARIASASTAGTHVTGAHGPDPRGQILNPRTKGNYEVTVTVEAITSDSSGNEVRTQVYSQTAPFRIIA
jgi:hypothetical protein